MADVALAPEDTRPLSEVQRVTDTFLAPSRTFTDLLRRAAWWLPFLLIVLSGYVLTAAIQQKVGWSQLAANELHAKPKMEERLSTLTPEQQAAQHRGMMLSFQGAFYAAPVVDIALYALMAVFLWPTINFGFGGHATYGRVLSMVVFASLPNAIKGLLAAALLYAGRSPDTFTTETLLGSNAGYYVDTPGALKTLLTSLDVFTLWTVVLLGMGLAIVARTKASYGYIAVIGWWVVLVLLGTATAAMQS